MPRFVVFFSYTPEAWSRMIDQPGDRTAAASASAEAVGARLEALYWMLGEQDGMVILEAPDAETATASVVSSVSSGDVRSLGTHQLLDQEQLRSVLDKARRGRDAFRRPGS
ncbi:GYD domain-containing protein [Geodermatophilus sp. SYSU D01180]